VNIAILAAGAGGMYCGSCLRDNALAQALIRMGHKVALIPLYTPLRTDTPDASNSEVFYGGINSYLQYASSIFRYTPRILDWLFDRPWMLNMAGRRGAQTPPSKLGGFMISILKGEEGPQTKELRRLAAFAKHDVKPQIVSLPNLMFIGMARMLREETGAPVVLELTGEDIFLDALTEPHLSHAKQIIRQRAKDVDQFVATSAFYADRMADYLAISRERIEVVYPGITKEHLKDRTSATGNDGRPPTVGYFARICPEKGIDRLVAAFKLLKGMPGMRDARLRCAGFLGSAHESWFDDLKARAAQDGIGDSFEYVGEVDLAGKLAFLDSIDVLSVPTAYQEAKGIYVLEAWARGVPVVQPRHGSFPELIEMTGGGVLVPPNDATALAKALADLLADAPRRQELGRRGREAVTGGFTDEHMAKNMLVVYEGLTSRRSSARDATAAAVQQGV
jgi:glycosyltransferase involved in cell wall biosynthesis